MERCNMECGAEDVINHSVKLLLNANEQNPCHEHKPSIYMVPSVFRDLSPSSFHPRMVSIGPLHRDDTILKRFEVQKVTYLHDLLERIDSKPEEILKQCLNKVITSIDRIRACYVGMKTCDNLELARMMVLDSCFMLDFLYHLKKKDGPLNKNMLIIQAIAYDLLLIENQIPFFVLEDIFECTILKLRPTIPLTKYLIVLLNYYNVFQQNLVIGNVGVDTTHDHILGLLHKAYQPDHDIQSDLKSDPQGHSAMELDRAGVNFRPNEEKNWPMAMKLDLPKVSCFPLFGCKPTLRMPVVCINDFTDLVLRNLIIYEQYFQVPNYVTAYAYAMDMLIDTPEDVGRLVKSKVLVNDLGSNEKAAQVINDICKEVPIIHFFYYEEWKHLDNYYYGYLPNIMAGLRRRYFNSSWNIIALFAGIVLFALTVVQTIYTINSA